MKNKLRSRSIYYNFFLTMSKKHNLDIRIVENVCLSSFKYLKEAIKNEEELKPIMLTYLGKFKLKKQFEKDKTIKFKNEK